MKYIFTCNSSFLTLLADWLKEKRACVWELSHKFLSEQLEEEIQRGNEEVHLQSSCEDDECMHQLEAELWCPSIDVDVFPCLLCDLDLLSPKSNQVISKGLVVIPCDFHVDCSSNSWDMVFKRLDHDGLQWPWPLTVLVNIPYQFYQNYSSGSWDIVATISDRTNGRKNEWMDGTA